MSELQATGDLLALMGSAELIEPTTKETIASRELRPESLLSRVRQGSNAAFEDLYRLYSPMVHGLLLARVPWQEADDLMQDIFIFALTKINTLRDDAAFGGWLAMIARNRAHDFYRRSRKVEELADDYPGQNGPDPAAIAALAAIKAMPEAYRETLILRLVEGMTGPEIAVRTGLTPDSVRVNLHRGMKLLREQLGIAKSKGDGSE